jgi:hypothetical protein
MGYEDLKRFANQKNTYRGTTEEDLLKDFNKLLDSYLVWTEIAEFKTPSVSVPSDWQEEVTSATKILITKVSPLPDLNLLVTFSNNQTLRVDFKPILQGTGSPISEQTIFNQVKLIKGFPTWPGGIDIEPEDLYELGEPHKVSASSS